MRSLLAFWMGGAASTEAPAGTPVRALMLLGVGS